MNHAQYYVPLQKSRDLLASRSGLRQQVEDFWLSRGWGLPPQQISRGRNISVLARQLVTFRMEEALFVTMSKQAGLEPVLAGYSADKHSSQSRLKQSYLSPKFIEGRNKNNELIIRRDKLTAKSWHGTPLHCITLDKKGGTSLVDYHQSILDRASPGTLRCDVSEWYTNIPWNDRYIALMSWFIAHAVLFEDYHGGESGPGLSALTRQRFEPAFHQATRMFGVSPIITPLPWWNELSYYPQDADWQRLGIIPQELLQAVA